MTKTDREPRSSGILNPDDQQIAQELFDHALNNDKEIVLRKGDELTMVTVTRYGARRKSMELYRDSHDVGQVTLKLRRGRRFWHDDGAEGLGGFIGDLSKVEPEPFRPNAEL